MQGLFRIKNHRKVSIFHRQSESELSWLYAHCVKPIIYFERIIKQWKNLQN
ncbi:hypothetical protein BFV94_3821 [Alteromonas macleodii]|uniref:Transposase n=1 Tax=Alteromonas macleodii TaxID=28108 RepID=A0AB36FP30_ALTMA|nr:hypothetical protein BFV95_3826 [Alteromonas macleodii]OES26775.1 hypothetical protein BFV94_3821 [Alteromonas macleodii]OES27010.1 hypothetical protein BFV93_3816 [Alteromonas macleodii]OES39206.1 hypothetical protein BFV96_3810 [Alteromonas macleodii]